jgi:hypothetical protein
MSPSVKDEVARILDRAKHELLALSLAEQTPVESVAPVPEWLTPDQLADYWQLRNKKGKLSTSGLLKWVTRGPEDFPLPHARMGDLLRFKRDEINQWAKDEAERRRVRKNKTPTQETDGVAGSKLRRTLTAVG